MLGWQLLDADRCQIYSFNFIYHFDINKNKPRFKILTEKNSYIVSDLIWEYIEEYEIYNFKLIDRKKVVFTIDKQGQNVFQTYDIENDYRGDDGVNNTSDSNALNDSTIFTFDVSKLGEYVSFSITLIFLIVRHSQDQRADFQSLQRYRYQH